MKSISGYIAALPDTGRENSKIALIDADTEYHIIPKGAGVELSIHLSKQVEIQGDVTEREDAAPLLFVRAYQLLDPSDDDSWYED
jgi:hypothetical protein